MKKHILLAIFLLSACSGQGAKPALTEQPPDNTQYQADLSYCEDWAKPTKHEWAQRCAAQGNLVMMAQLIASFDNDDPRDKDASRQSVPNSTQYRLNMCMKAKGYKINMPGDGGRIAMK
jgi:hypothetical protein